jgi:hypothetical protein
MAPRTEAAAKENVAQGAPPPKKAKTAVDDVDKKAQSNFVTQMAAGQQKGTLTPDQQDAWSKYRSMGRFDVDKKELIAQWKVDKSCKWIQHFSKSSEKETSVASETISGWGTRCDFYFGHFLSNIFQFHILSISYYVI